MREIKFRAWNKIDSKKIDLNGLDIEFSGCQNIGSVYRIYEQGRIEHYDINDVILEQYTGLKDKNGVEIYEGDILKWTKHDGKKYNNQVYYCAGSMTCGFKVKGGHWHDSLTRNRIYNAKAEIIGNIHENPELLTSK